MSRNNSTYFPTNTADIKDTPVMLPPGRAKLATIPVSTGSAAIITMGYLACYLLRRQGARDVERYDHIDLEPHQFDSKLGESIQPSFGGTELVVQYFAPPHSQVHAFRPGIPF